MNYDNAAQGVIFACGAATVWLSQDPQRSRQRWACIIGALVQPVWMWVTWRAGQYGMLVLSFVYLAGWLRGVRTYWVGRG